MMWDDEFDVVCCGSGFGALACAVAAADAGLDVLIVQPGIEYRHGGEDSVVPLLAAGIEDPETREYFDALSADLGSSEPADAQLTVRSATDLVPAKPGGLVAPFYGARLRDWASECLHSPYGVLYTRLTGRQTTAMKTHSGEEIEVKVVGSLTPDSTGAATALSDWLTAQIRNREIPTYESSALNRIVFEEGEIVGVVIDTPDGRQAIRARHGVAVDTLSQPGVLTGGVFPADEPGRRLQVWLVGHSASRFARVELFAADVAADSISLAYCRSPRVHDGLRDAGRSHVRHWRKTHRNPPLG
ncbi:FAD-binding protein [Mycobacterium sp. 155]|uniref:FAD-binding protein n=1 Tax=Mycobacterium sp. 155 TaxID=1157943 RepID=UPI0004780B83|nr:FAD-binding protein [Mycobacterium sp. 155]